MPRIIIISMKKIFVLIFVGFSFSGLSQSVKSVFENLEFKEVKSLNDFENLKTAITTSDKSSLMGFCDSRYKEKVIFNSKDSLLLFLYYSSDSLILALNVYDLSGNNLFYWEFESIASDCHRISLYGKKKKKIIIGCQKGGKFNYHGFSKELFTGDTMSKNINELNQMLGDILKRYYKSKR